MIIFINGSINAGKTTIANILKKKIPNTAIVEIDELRKIIDWMPIDEAVPINLENAISVIKNLVKRGMNILVPYPLSEKNYNYIVRELKGIDAKLHFFTLAPKLETILADRGERELSTQEVDRIKYHYEIGIQNPSFGEIIDNSKQTPEETAKFIISRLS
jgi:adenylate kinase family enzyme